VFYPTKGEIRELIREENDILLDEIVKIVNMSLLCKDGGRVVRRTPEEQKEIESRRGGSHP
jgi:hypothetical protein